MQKTIYPARLMTLDLSFLLGSDNVSSQPRTRLAKLNLSNGKSLYAKLVVSLSINLHLIKGKRSLG